MENGLANLQVQLVEGADQPPDVDIRDTRSVEKQMPLHIQHRDMEKQFLTD
jgi:hypothetical protein